LLILQTWITSFAKSIPITFVFLIVWTPLFWSTLPLLKWGGGVHTSL
jgi:hypothetical protein